jgi:inhibitor of cysteine peptidase
MVAFIALIVTLHLTAADNNKVFSVKPQTPIVVTLASNPSTGYRWKLAPQRVHGVVRLVSHRYVGAKSGLPGAPGKEIWRFRAVAKGATDLGFLYLRSWEKNKPARRISIAIRVR